MSDYQSNVPANLCTVKATLAAGTTTTISNTGTIYYSINGKAYSKSAMTNAATPTTDLVTGAAFVGVKANKGSIFIIGLLSAGSVRVVQGSIVDLDSSGAFTIAPQIGPHPSDFCAIGYLLIKAGSTADATTGWVLGTSNNTGVTGITQAFGDLMTWPSRPIIS